MLEIIRELLEQSPMLALFAVIGLGYALGQISIAGFSLGVGAVLFAGLALGAIATKAVPPGLVSSIGLVMFLYGIGIQYGKQFFAGLSGPGLKWNVLAAIEAAGNRDAAIGYSVAYPFGVIGPILCLYVFARTIKPRLVPTPAPLQPLEITLDDPKGSTVAELIAQLPVGVELIAVRQAHTNKLPDPELQVAAGDGLLLFGQPEALEKARLALGRIAKDRGTLDVAWIFVSRPTVVGTTLGQVKFPNGIIAKIAEVRRGDAVLFPASDLVLEYGDRIGVIATRSDIPALRKYVGDSLKSTAEFSYISVGLGMSLGVLLGLIAVPIPGIGAFSLGLAGGPLIVALILGKMGRAGMLSWHIPLAANLTLRNFGLTLFLAAVGLGAGAPFVKTVSE